MTQSKKKTPPFKMKMLDMTLEHTQLDSLIGKHNPDKDSLTDLGFTVGAAKVRRCKLKTAIQSRMMRGDQDAIAYGEKRKWQTGVALVSV